MPFSSIDIKLSLILSAVFILFTVVGTLSHEYGHILLAKTIGYETTLHYGSMNYDISKIDNEIENITQEYRSQIENESDFEKKEEYELLLKKQERDMLLIKSGGPLQTIITGCIGLLILLIRRKKIYQFGLSFLDWLAIFLSLFWSREIFNLATSWLIEIVSPDGNWFGGDEYYISKGIGLWEGSLSLILASIATYILLFVIFKIIPKSTRISFIFSGIIGGISGFILWMHLLGPKLLP